MPRVIHFELHADQPERAIAFYTGMFGWTFSKWNGPMDYWLISTGPESQKGINGGLVRRIGPPPVDGQPVNAYVCTVEVPDVDAAVNQAGQLGGTVALPKIPIPGIGWLAHIKDTEGTILSLMQSDPSAK